MWRVTTLFNGPYVNGGGIQQFYFDSSVGTAANAKLAAQTFWDAAQDAVHVTTNIRVTSEVENVNVAGSIVSTTIQGVDFDVYGTDDSDPLPPQTQALCRWRTGIYAGGREVRGRTFIPSAGEAFSVAGVPGGGRLTTLQNACAALVADANSTLLVWSRKYQIGEAVVSGTVAPYFAVLRSRRD